MMVRRILFMAMLLSSELAPQIAGTHFESEPVALIRLRIEPYPVDIALDTRQEILYSFVYDKDDGFEWIIIPLDEFFIQFVLRDDSGNLIERTDLGATFGSRYDELKTFSREAIKMNRRGRPTRMRAYSRRLEFFRGRPMYAGSKTITIDDLFQDIAPGHYTLTCRAQAFKTVEIKGRVDHVLLKFPAFEIPVVKHHPGGGLIAPR